MSPAEPQSNSTSSLRLALSTAPLEAATCKWRGEGGSWSWAQTIISAPSWGFCCLVKPCCGHHPVSSISQFGLLEGRRGHVRPQRSGKALSGGANWPEKTFLLEKDQHPSSGYPTCRFTTHHPQQEDVKRCQLCYSNMPFVTETDTFQLAISLHRHCPIQAKSSCEHDANHLSMQSDIPKCAGTTDQDLLITPGLSRQRSLMTILSHDTLPSHFPQRHWIKGKFQWDLNL